MRQVQIWQNSLTCACVELWLMTLDYDHCVHDNDNAFHSILCCCNLFNHFIFREPSSSLIITTRMMCKRFRTDATSSLSKSSTNPTRTKVATRTTWRTPTILRESIMPSRKPCNSRPVLSNVIEIWKNIRNKYGYFSLLRISVLPIYSQCEE